MDHNQNKVMEAMEKSRIKRIYRMVLAAAAWFGSLGYGINYLAISGGEGTLGQRLVTMLNFYYTFTVQTNLMVAIWLTVAVFFWWQERDTTILKPRIKGALTLYIATTFIIYASILDGHFEFYGIERVLSITCHYVVPLGFIFDWVVFTEKGAVARRDGIYWLAYPLAYMVFSLMFGALTGTYFYFFVDVSVLGWRQFTLNVLMLLGFFLLLGQGVIAVNRRRGAE